MEEIDYKSLYLLQDRVLAALAGMIPGMFLTSLFCSVTIPLTGVGVIVAASNKSIVESEVLEYRLRTFPHGNQKPARKRWRPLAAG